MLPLALLLTQAAPAQAVTQSDCSSTLSIQSGVGCGASDSASRTSLFGHTSLFTAISNTIIFLVGAVSVIMVIVGGLRYTLSGGDPKATADAKNTILYAIVGLVVAALAYAIVTFVIQHVA